jgi:hypothetical protein
MKGMPDRAAYRSVLIIDDSYMEAYIQQLYEHHKGHISRNRDQMDYFILLLNVLIERGSTMAFRMRDDIILRLGHSLESGGWPDLNSGYHFLV